MLKFDNLNSEKILEKLNEHFCHYSYIGGFYASQADTTLLKALSNSPLKNQILSCNHIRRWYEHLKTFSEKDSKQFPNYNCLRRNIQVDPDILKMMTSDACNDTKEKNMQISKSSKNSKIVLKTPKGTKDFSPKEMLLRRQVFNKIIKIFQMHGAVEIETPVFELREVLTGKYGEDSKLIYDLDDQGGEILSMRYDLTVPFARYVAMNKISNIKRYHIARVYRRDNPSIARGRYREFYQCDFDIAGQYDLMLPDAECIQIVHQVLSALNLGHFLIKVNHRKILDGLFKACGVPPESFHPICSAVDKLDKSPWEDVRNEMINEKKLAVDVADLIGEYVNLSGKEELIKKMQEDDRLMNSETAQEGLKDMKLLFDYVNCLGCEQHVIFDMGLARGLDYYTGVIYEAVMCEGSSAEDGTVGSVAAGGRYDNLVGMFDAKKKTVPCVGISFGIERLCTLQQRKYQSENAQLKTTHTEVYVASAGKALQYERLKLLSSLHAAGVFAESSYKNSPKLLSQYQFAEENAIPLIALIGESEIMEETVKLRVTKTREEETVPRDKLVEVIKNKLGSLTLES